MLFIFFVLLIPVFCNAKIRIHIHAASSLEYSSVRSSGIDLKTVTDREIALFNLTKDNLIRGIRIELGRYPEDVFLTDPTPYENLFEKFKWPPVRRKLTIEAVKIIDIINEPVQVTVQEFINNTTKPIKRNIGIYKTVESTVFSTWSKTGFPVDNITYGIKVSYRNSNKTFEYENLWRSTLVRNQMVRFGASKPGYVKVEPGQKLRTTLNGFKTIVLVEVTYKASVIGNVIGDFEELEGIHYHFFAPTVRNIMKAADIYNELITTEEVEVRCFTDPRVEVSIEHADVEIVTARNRAFVSLGGKRQRNKK
ncbi:uncharacterized protein LOC105387148 [Plutella xylostella]|uniref:uncharacterized protein LOC105387148 n=1 Tax=Plutella xylostella TaxID=51655 RepID=UPI0020326F4B|nr:uncharacterized protein LOC105387148 [Plutella xylostella]